MTMQDYAAIILAAIGVIFMLISAIGLVRLPDVFSRMHAAGKATTVGISFILVSAGIYFWDRYLMLRMLVLIVLILATSPISTSAMARAAYRTGAAKRLHLRHDAMADDLAVQETAASVDGNSATTATVAPRPPSTN
jgi:multicomponent Na+:H+ antiporter subunit G